MPVTVPEPAQLFLVTPLLSGTPAEMETLRAALAAAPVACVLLRHAGHDGKALVRQFGPLVQGAGAACLLEGDPRKATRAGADGLQLRYDPDALADAIASLKPERIVGCAGLASRDDAMTAGELDVDYLLFGEAEPDGTWPDPAWTLERVDWWAEIFNVPCVGFAQGLAEVGPLAEAGADFVALGDAVFGDVRGPAAALADAVAALARAAALRAPA